MVSVRLLEFVPLEEPWERVPEASSYVSSSRSYDRSIIGNHVLYQDGLSKKITSVLGESNFFQIYVSRLREGYCWRISFKVLEVLFLGHVSQAFLPSKQACRRHTLRHLRVRQQYPGVYFPLCRVVQ